MAIVLHSHRAAEQSAHARHSFVYVNWFWLQPLPPRKREKLRGQARATFRRGAHVAEPSTCLRIVARIALQELDIPKHDGKKVIEVVSYARSELPHRF